MSNKSLILFFILLPYLTYAQEYKSSIQNINTIDGLSQNSVSHILQDKEGMVWLATQVGLDKCTGTDIININFSKSLLENMTLLQDWDDTNIFVGTDKGNYLINKWNQKSYKTLGLKFTDVHKISRLPGKDLLFFTNHAVWQCDSSLKNLSYKTSISATIEEVLPLNNNTWFLATDKGLFTYSYLTNSFDHVWKEYAINTLCYNRDSTAIFLATALHNIFKYQIDQRKVIDTCSIPHNNNQNSFSSVTSLFLDKTNQIWVGTENAGLYLLDFDNHTSSPIPGSSKGINCILSSKDNVIWVGTNTRGVDLFQGGRQFIKHYFDNATVNHKISGELMGNGVAISHNNNVWSVLPIHGSDSLLLGTNGNGLAVLNLKRYKDIGWIPASTAMDNPRQQFVYAMLKTDKGVLLGTKGGIYQWEPDQKRNYYKPVMRDKIRVKEDTSISLLKFDCTGKYIFAGDKSSSVIYVFDKDLHEVNNIILPHKDENLSFIYNIIQKNDSFTLVGTTQSLYRLNSYNSTLLPFYKFSEKTHFICAYQKRYSDTVWIGTDRKGFYCFNIAHTLKYPIADAIDGLPMEVIYAIQGDRAGNLWLSTNHGIYKFISGIGFNSFANTNNPEIHEFNTGSYTTIGDSTIIFGGLNGISAINPIIDNLPEDVNFFKPVIKYSYSIKSDYFIDYNIAHDNSEENKFFIPYKFGHLEISPMLGSYQDPQNTQFKFELNGKRIYQERDGKFIIYENQLSSSVLAEELTTLHLGSVNKLNISFRTATGRWHSLPVISIYRNFLTGSNILYIPLVIIVVTILFLLYRYFSTWKGIKTLLEKINVISRIDDIETLCQTGLDHILNALKFEYAVISLIDFDKYKIESLYCRSKRPERTRPEDWMKFSSYPLDDDNILSQTALIGEDVIVINKVNISNKKIRVTVNLYSDLIAKHYKQHERLASIYIPIVHRASLDHSRELNQRETNHEDVDVVMGVIEAGFTENRLKDIYLIFLYPIRYLLYFFKPRAGALKRLEHHKISLQLYIDNFAQPYYKAYIKKQQNEMERMLRSIDKQSNSAEKFLQEALDSLKTKLGAKYAIIALTSYNAESIELVKKGFFSGCTQEQVITNLNMFEDVNKGKSGIIKHVITTKEPYYKNEVKKDEKYIKAFDDANSEMTFAMLLHKNAPVIGVIDFLSSYPQYFNAVIVAAYQDVITKITEIYLQKKQYRAIQDIVPSFESFSHSESNIYVKAVSALENYFDTEYISVWVRNSYADFSFQLHDTTTPWFFNEYKNAGLTSALIHEEYKEGESMVEIKEIGDSPGKRNRFLAFCSSQHNFKFYITLKIIIDNKYHAFINIFSKRKKEDDEISGYSRVFLEEIVKKITLETLRNQLANSIEVISRSLAKHDIENSKQIIVDQACILLPSVDSVVLFTYKQGQLMTLKDAHVGGTIPYEDQKNKEKPANFANLIIQTKSEWIDEEETYLELAKKALPDRPSRDNFWQKKDLQAVAAIRLDFSGDPIGVMFFNYKIKQDFKNENIRQYINSFIDFAKIALINKEFISRIENAKTKLNEEKEKLIENQKALQKAKDDSVLRAAELNEQMKELLPSATMTSLFEIVQQINHDIITQLYSIKLDLINIEKNSHLWIKKESDRREMKENISSVENNIKKSSELIVLFKPAAFKESNTDLAEIIQLTTKLFSRKYSPEKQNQSIEFDLTGVDKTGIPLIYCIRAEISMIIYNLITNAEKAINEKKETFIEGIPSQYRGKISISCSYDTSKKKYVFEITDNGVGIDKKDLNKIYNAGFTSRKSEIGKTEVQKVHGIGLYFIRECLKRHYNGTISCISYKGESTTFTLRFDHYQEEKEEYES